MKAKIVDIKRFAVHDGDGIRTTVFLKGCPLKCRWCHNPESISFKPQLGYIDRKCINCGKCTEVCEAHIIENGKHKFKREKCIACGKCEKVCLGEALKFYGQDMTVEEIMPILLEDKDFYDNSNGGVTLSGGEPLMQADFCAELLKSLKNHGINTAVDTCGFVSREAIDKVIDYTDIFLYDIKGYDEQKHIICTGQTNKIILENIKYISDKGKAIEVRIPFVPSMNDDTINDIGKFLSTVGMIKKIKVLPYHNFAGSKYESLDMENTLPVVELPTDEMIGNAVNILRTYDLKAVSGKD